MLGKTITTTLAATLGTLALFLAATLALIDSTIASFTSPTATTLGAGRGCVPAVALRVAGLRDDQIQNAATIVAVGTQLGVPPQGWVVALATALTESGLRNLPYGDRDSLGLFQQRPSQGWGTRAQILDPRYSSTQFYRHLQALPRWQSLSVNNAAQAIQRSATPTAYAVHEPAARALVHTLTGTATCTTHDAAALDQLAGAQAGMSGISCDSPSISNRVAAAVIAFACARRGTPYVWGGTGTRGFDCSGLTQAAYAAAGISLPRTAQAQFNAGPHPSDSNPPQAGDLPFFGTDTRHITHVGIAVSPARMIDAPDIGQRVDVHPIPHTRLIGLTRPWATGTTHVPRNRPAAQRAGP